MRTSKKLHSKLARIGRSMTLPTNRRSGRPEIPSVEELIQQGRDPVFAVYAFVQKITSVFAETVSRMLEMKTYAKVVAKAEDEYMPSGPPMSPLTGSFFTSWAFFDLKFDGADTLANCLIEANDFAGLKPDQLDALKNLADSRMGVYEHIGIEGPHVRLRELVTETEYTCHVPAGYRGRSGELWYVRLLPPLMPDSARHHVAFTTPYILMTRRADWLDFFQRALADARFGPHAEGLHRFLKFGRSPNEWNEFVFASYHHHQSDAIFLTGIPDRKDTLPHA